MDPQLVLALAKVGMDAFDMIERHVDGREVTNDELDALEARAKGAAQRFRDLVTVDVSDQ